MGQLCFATWKNTLFNSDKYNMQSIHIQYHILVTGGLGIVAQRGTKTISTSDISAKTTVEADTEGNVRNSVEYMFVWVMVCSSVACM